MLVNVQALRVLAALTVVLVHLAPVMRSLGLPTTMGGVDLFFVISGFIMVLVGRDLRPAEFLKRRLIRIVPLYWAMTLITFATALVLPALFANTSADPIHLLKSVLFVPFVKAGADAPQPILFVGWTMNYEVFFYLVFGAALLTGRRAVGVATAALLALVGAGFVFRPEAVPLAFYTSPVLLNFVFGMVVAAVYQRGETPLWFAAPMTVLAASAAFFGDRLLPGLPTSLSMGLAGAALLFLVLQLERRGLRLSHPFALRLGEATYAWYLTHPFVTGAVLVGFASAPQDRGLTLAFLIGGVAATALVGLAVRAWIERPMTKALARALDRREVDPARPVVGVGPA